MTEKILVIRLSSLGDIILTEPIVRSLRAAKPTMEFHFLTKSGYSPLARMMPDVAVVHEWVDDDDASLLTKLGSMEFCGVFDLHRNWRSREVCAILKAPIHRAEKEWFKRWAAVKMKWLSPKPAHAIERYAASLRSADVPVVDEVPRLNVPQVAREWWQAERARLKLSDDYCLLAPAAAHDTKAAPVELWVSLARAAQEIENCSVVLSGAPHERQQLERVAAAIDGATTPIVADSHIVHAAAVVEGARFAVTNDSGLAHLAAAVQTPVVSLFGPTHPILGFEPKGAHAAAYSVKEFCSPCSRHGAKACYRDQRYCFTKMSVEKIMTQLRRLRAVEKPQ